MSYEDALKAACAEVHAVEYFGSYQGDRTRRLKSELHTTCNGPWNTQKQSWDQR